MTNDPADTVWAVTGASGALATEALAFLADRIPDGVTIRAISRNPADVVVPAALERRIELHAADFTDVAGYTRALAGVERVLFISTHEWEGGDRAPVHLNAVEAIAAAGVSRVVYTSFVGAEAGSPDIIENDHGLTENALAALGIEWVAVRHHLYFEQLVSHLLSLLLRDGHFYIPKFSMPTSYVSRRNCAQVDAALLLADEIPSGPVEVTGPDAFDFLQLGRKVAGAIGYDPIVVMAAPVDLAAKLGSHGLGEHAALNAAAFASSLADGLFGNVEPTVLRYTGNEPDPIEPFLLPLAGG